MACKFRTETETESIHKPILTGKPVKGSLANSADQAPHAPDQSLQCLLTGFFFIKNRIKTTK